MNSYQVGNVVRLSSTFTANSAATDPTTITLYIKGPSVGLAQYTYAAGQLVRDSAGNYHYDFTVPASGVFYYRWEGTGTVVAAAENSFQGGPSNFK